MLAAWARCSICNIWSVIVSERKIILLLFAFYALCHFGSLIIITEYIWRRVPDADSHRRCTCWGFVRVRSNFRKWIIPDLSFQSLSLVNIWKMEIQLLVAQVHFQTAPLFFPFCSCPLQSFVLTPLVLFILSFWLCQQYCTVQHLGVFDKQNRLLGLQRSLHLLSTHIPSPNLTNTFYFSTFPVYTCTVLLLVLWWRFLHLHFCRPDSY